MNSIRKILFGFMLGMLFMRLCGYSQSLADIARQEKERREQQKAGKRVYTNEDLNKYERSAENASEKQSTDSEEPSSLSRRAPPPTTSDAEERVWSKRFIEAKGNIEQLKSQGESLQAKLNNLNMQLLRQSDVFDREHVYGQLIAQTKQQIEQNKSDLTAAQQALEDLREALRKGGHPPSWEDSQAALKPAPQDDKKEEHKTKDQRYWQEQLATIDKRYEALISPLEAERFELVNRRAPKDGESTTPSTGLGMGMPPRVIDIDVQIKDLNKKRDQDKQQLVDQAIREGALPGWFR